MLEIYEPVSLRGKFYLRVYKNGILTEEWEDPNLIVNGARHLMAHVISGETETMHISQIAFGTNESVPEVTDTLIKNQFAKSLSGHSFPKIGEVRFSWLLKETENNGMAISEFGLLLSDGTLFARKSRTFPINKDSDISLEGHWTISF